MISKIFEVLTVTQKENAKILTNNLPGGIMELKQIIPPAFVSNCFRK